MVPKMFELEQAKRATAGRLAPPEEQQRQLDDLVVLDFPNESVWGVPQPVFQPNRHSGSPRGT
jgi:hypothetical protein